MSNLTQTKDLTQAPAMTIETLKLLRYCAYRALAMIGPTPPSPSQAYTHWMKRDSANEARRDEQQRLAAKLYVPQRLQDRPPVEEALAENHQHLASIYNTVKDVIFELAVEPEAQFRFVSVNAAFSKVTGLSREVVIGKSVNQVIPEPSLTMVLGKYRKAIEERTTVTWEETSDYPTGRLIGEVSVAPVFDDKGMCTHLIGSVHDITERKRAETALRQSEERFAMAQNAAQIGVWDSDLRTNLITISGQFAYLFGLSPDRTMITRQEWSHLIHPDDRQRVDELRREARERTHVFDTDFRIAWPDGSTHWIHAKGTVSIDDVGQPSRTTGVVWDVTQRKHADAKLAESEERFRTVFEEGPLGVALVARDGRFLTINNALSGMLGYRKEDLVQKIFADITHPDDSRPEMELIERLFKGEIPFYRKQTRYVKKTGEIVWTNVTASLLHDRESNSVQRLTMFEDVTEIKRGQEAAMLRQKLESVGTLASGIAHDFNNLLGAVLAQAELAQLELAEGSSPEEELKTICATAMRGAEIVRELMIYAGRESKSPELVDVSEVIEQMLELLKISISKRATFETDLSRSLPSIRASTAQISQLVMNLATNASEALGELRGTIRIRAQRTKVGDGSHQVQGLAAGEYVQIEVSDTGCGIPTETQARIFDPFFSTKSAGRGLGLAVVHGIVQDLNGAITLVSEPGHGTTFKILLPRAEARSDSKFGSDMDRPGRQSAAATVLVVEDEDQLGQAVSKMLAARGFSVIEARNGTDALNVIRNQSNTIDVLLLDMTLPGASSRDVLREARRLRPQVKVIVTSAYAEEMTGPLLKDTVEHFIRKPYRISDLVQLIVMNTA